MVRRITTSDRRPRAKITISAILAIIVGILIIAFPAILAWAVGLYLVITGLLDLFNK